MYKRQDVDALKKLLDTLGKVGNLREGKVADSPLRQAKNIFLGLVSLVGKTAAIPGGMDDEEAYTLIDLYAQACEQAPTVEAVKLLQYNMLLDFTQRVAKMCIRDSVNVIYSITTKSPGKDNATVRCRANTSHIFKNKVR